MWRRPSKLGGECVRSGLSILVDSTIKLYNYHLILYSINMPFLHQFKASLVLVACSLHLIPRVSKSTDRPQDAMASVKLANFPSS